ncbi:MAG TPA: undecaprenyl-diphosphate phosphatase, partial [Pirellulaceae bacterium]|nr:undecaprenyl-diphosphate phosphatase [Pirellulaceae bacterium]
AGKTNWTTMQQFSLLQVLVLAVVQGVTEFIPVSSDGHLALVEPLIWGGSAPRPNSMDLTIVLHLGTLGSILVYYRERILRLLGEDRGVLWLIVLGTIPAVVLVLGCKLLLNDAFEEYLKDVRLAGLMLPVTGAALIWSQRHAGGNRQYRELKWTDSVLIGIAQAAAILPGLSRSGSTIAAGLTLGMSRSAAATYSFLLAIPALAGAGVYEAFKMLKQPEPLSASPRDLAIGAAVSFAVGLAALALLQRVVERGRLHYFGWYCVGLGVVVVALTWRH